MPSLLSTGALVLLAAPAVASTARYLRLRRGTQRLARALRTRRGEGRTNALAIDLGDRSLEELAAEVNTLARRTDEAERRRQAGETEFRRLIADISHDLRTPLTAIRGYQQLLAADELPAGSRDRLEIAQKHTDELAELVERLFEYSYVVGSPVPSGPPVDVDLVRLVTDVVLGQVEPLEEAGLAVEVTGDDVVEATLDAEAMTRLVGNLVRNAWQHGAGWVSIDVRGVGEEAALVVTNGLPNGVRVDPETIFERFAVADRARAGHARARGAGLGLAIVRRLAQQLGGSATGHLEDAGTSPRGGDGAQALSIEVRVPRRPRPIA